MRFCLALFISILMLSSQPSWATPGYRIDPQATAQAQWKPGEVIVEEDAHFMGSVTHYEYYRKFIGITDKGYAVVQDFYTGSDNKFTDPYVVMQPDRIDEIWPVILEAGKSSSALLDGKLTFWYENGQKASEYHYHDGNMQGLSTEWYENGQRAIEINFQNDKPQGLLTQWYENGQKAVVGHFQNGKQQGLWTQWDENGKKISETRYEAGEVVSDTEF